jgi:hypothetical protein
MRAPHRGPRGGREGRFGLWAGTLAQILLAQISDKFATPWRAADGERYRRRLPLPDRAHTEVGIGNRRASRRFARSRHVVVVAVRYSRPVPRPPGRLSELCDRLFVDEPTTSPPRRGERDGAVSGQGDRPVHDDPVPRGWLSISPARGPRRCDASRPLRQRLASRLPPGSPGA